LIEASAVARGSRADVWALLADADAWSRWGSWSESSVEEGREHGPGAVRVLYRRPYRVRERVTEWVPEERMAYELLEGMKGVRGYRASVTLADEPGGGTRITWRSEYERAGPWTALVLRLAARDSVRRLAKAAG
jgi:uncharacterized protein YndB with AHSA1/START domain